MAARMIVLAVAKVIIAVVLLGTNILGKKIFFPQYVSTPRHGFLLVLVGVYAVL